MSIIEVKVRKVGTSLGVLLPKDILVERGIKEGEKISVIIPKKNLKLLREAFGSVNEKVKFERDRIDRLERYKNASR